MFLALIGLIPGLLNLVQAWQKMRFDAQVAIVQAKTGADRDTAVALARTAATEAHESTERLKAIAGSNALLFLVFLFALPLAFYIWKVVGYDIVIGSFHGCAGKVAKDMAVLCAHYSTDPIQGQVADWATTIIAGIFGATTSLALGHMYFNRKQDP